ncbi:MAG: oxygen-independent coproporphyrinogen III oxidase [Verrucomicrobia bacterium]|nr:oxygen-independent coproporphyrinogen III oxidase [Verrucomicrobiota bacterium]
MNTLSVDLNLVRKYDIPGPRYTSYPPATRFSEEYDEERLHELIQTNKQSQRDLSLYCHIPFCESLCWFCGCTTVITSRHQEGTSYLGYLDKEMALFCNGKAPHRKVVQMHLGGGTPTFLRPDEIKQLGSILHKHFGETPDCEAGVEVDPRRLTREHVTALWEAGFNRASMGVQDNNAKVQKAINRIQPMEITRNSVDWLREAGFESINIDLIYGLPHQTESSFEKTLEEIIELSPNRLAVFSYAHVPWIKPAQKILERDNLPTPETKLNLLKLIIEKLTSEGYVYVGMDHFARPDDELAVAQSQKTLQRNFQGYSTFGGADIHSFGMSSVSQIPDAYWQNIKELEAYYQAVDDGKMPIAKGCFVTNDEKKYRIVITRLMCDLSLDYDSLSNSLDINFREEFADTLEGLKDMEEDGLLNRNESRLTVTDTGRLFIRNIAMRFDPNIETSSTTRYSKTI